MSVEKIGKMLGVAQWSVSCSKGAKACDLDQLRWRCGGTRSLAGLLASRLDLSMSRILKTK